MSIGALALVAGLGAILLRYAQQDLLNTISTQQLGLVTRAAEDIDARLKLAFDSLVVSAGAMPADALASDAAFKTFYAQHPALLQLFDDLLVVTPAGRVTSVYPAKAGAIGLDIADRPYLQQAFATGKPVISDAVRSRLTGKPLVNIAVPVLGPDGEITAALVGTLPLAQTKLLGALSTAHVGTTGYFLLLSNGPRSIYLSHPNPSQLMQPVPASTPALVHVLEATAPGFASSALDDDDIDGEVLISYYPLKMKGWRLAAILPHAEAYAAIHEARRRAIEIGLIAALIVLPLVWLFAWRLLRPLSTLRREVERIAGDASGSTFATPGTDEVGQVARAFNEMLRDQRRSEAERVASDQDRRRLVAILESTQDFVTMTDVQGRVTYLNAAGRTMSGKDLNEDLRHTTMLDYFPAWVIDKLQKEGIPAALASGTWIGQTAVIDKHGREIPADHTVTAHRNVNGKLEFFSSLLHDTSAAVSAAATIRSSEARMLSIADALPVLVSFIGCDHRYRFVNSRYEEHFGTERSRIVGRTIAEMIGDEAFAVYEPYLARAARGEAQVFEVESRAGVRPAHFNVKLIPQYDDDRALIGYHFIHQDVTDHKVEQQRLSLLVQADALTGVLNRAGFESAIGLAMQHTRDHGSAMALFYLDVDRFKSINDRHGHPVGDRFLQAFAARLVRAVRGADIVSRLGGDEFVVIAEGLRSVDDVRSVARKILRAMRPEFDLTGTTLSITVSIGVAAFTGGPESAEALVARADLALYRAKDGGRDRYELDEPSRASMPEGVEAGFELTSLF